MRNIVILGAGGFVGTWLRRELAGREGVSVWPTAAGDLVDIRDEAALANLMRRRPDIVINLAAIASPSAAERQPELTSAVNHRGAIAVARTILTHAPECRLIHAGSAVADGDSLRAGRPLTEDDPLVPRGAYGTSKALADADLAALADEGLRITRLRPFWHAGPGQQAAYVVPAFASQVARIVKGLAPPRVAVGNLDVRRDFLDVRDVARLYADLATMEQGPPTGVYNVASGVATPIRALLDGLIARAGIPIAIDVDPQRLRPDEVQLAVGDPRRAAQALGWRPRLSLEAMLDDVLSEWLARPLN